MLSFLKRKTKSSSVAANLQEKAVAKSDVLSEKASVEKTVTTTSSKDTTIYIDCYGLSGNENWVYPNKNIQRPMPKPDDVIVGELPVYNCAVTAGWYFPGMTGDEEIIIEFSTEKMDGYMALAYEYGAVYGTKYIAIEFNRDLGVLVATAWGRNKKHCSNMWQVSVCMDVTRLFSNLVYQLPSGEPGMSIQLCNYDIVHKKIFGNNARTRIAYGVTATEADDIFNLLIDIVASTVCDANKKYVAHSLQARAVCMCNEKQMFIDQLHKLIEETDALTESCAVKQYYGIEVSSSDWEKAQKLYDDYISLANSLNNLGTLYYELRYVARLIGLKVNVNNLVRVINNVGISYEKLRGLLDLLRG